MGEHDWIDLKFVKAKELTTRQQILECCYLMCMWAQRGVDAACVNIVL